jgi:hypothetical protein
MRLCRRARLEWVAFGAASSDDPTDRLPTDTEPSRSFGVSTIQLYSAKNFSLALSQLEFGSAGIAAIERHDVGPGPFAPSVFVH